MHVFVLDKDKNPLAPCHPAKARRLLKSGRASVFRRYPFTLILHEIEAKDCVVPETQLNASAPLASTSLSVESERSRGLKIDPGSPTTGLAILSENRVIWASELSYRGQQIKNDLEKRRALRRSRRHRKTRYRKPRCLNRTRPKGWLPPSLNASAPLASTSLSVESERSRGLNHRVETTMTWVNRLRKLLKETGLPVEVGTGGQTKFNRTRLGLPKTHGFDAACVG
ncbi:RRXRR domain-containing protein, partial [Baaleninema simplex]|uniref:RRXRR domain-containing protein n=1 Tax=Baaleninema simplex TaxID=2862350 RepID=UPI000374CC8A